MASRRFKKMFKLLVFCAFVNLCFASQHQPKDVEQINHMENNVGIIGGETTTIEKHPYQISVTLSSTLFISGAILNKNWVLTTASLLMNTGVCAPLFLANAHPAKYSFTCNNFTNSLNISEHLTNGVQVRVGSNSSDSAGTLYPVEKTIIHPKFDFYNTAYDFALHKLSKPIKFGSAVKSIKVAPKQLKKGQSAVVSGWGATSASVNGNPYKQISLKGEDTKTCGKDYDGTGLPIDKTSFCGLADKSTDGPYFDFGAPLVLKNKLYGLYSFRIYGYPSVFADIHYALGWIKKTIKQ